MKHLKVLILSSIILLVIYSNWPAINAVFMPSPQGTLTINLSIKDSSSLDCPSGPLVNLGSCGTIFREKWSLDSMTFSRDVDVSWGNYNRDTDGFYAFDVVAWRNEQKLFTGVYQRPLISGMDYSSYPPGRYYVPGTGPHFAIRIPYYPQATHITVGNLKINGTDIEAAAHAAA